MSPDPEKVKMIKEWSSPQDKSEVKSFLQITQFCSVFMRSGKGRTYSDMTSPLRKLTNWKAKSVWSKECEDSFQELKKLLCSDMVMANYEMNRQGCMSIMGLLGWLGQLLRNMRYQRS